MAERRLPTGLLVVLGLSALSVFALGAAIAFKHLDPGGGDRVGVISVAGVITDTRDVIDDLRAFAERDDLEAIVVRIDSPGGAVAPSQELFEAMRYAAGKKPVVVSMGTVAASGGFWAAMAGDEIFASAGTITGSIGVISQSPDLRGLLDFLHVNMRTYKSGPAKDTGSPFRGTTTADEGATMELISDVYEQFLRVILERRGLDEAVARTIADGRVFTGEAAHRLGLIDHLGGLHAAAARALALAAERAGRPLPTEPPTLVEPPERAPSLLRLLAGSAGAGLAEGLVGGAHAGAGRPAVEVR